jgi:hypothetical protein
MAARNSARKNRLPPGSPIVRTMLNQFEISAQRWAAKLPSSARYVSAALFLTKDPLLEMQWIVVMNNELRAGVIYYRK